MSERLVQTRSTTMPEELDPVSGGEMIYKAPEKRIHRGFVYLDDETVTNSLSAVEAGKIDEVIAKAASAREGGMAGGLGVSPVKVEGGKKASASFEEEIVKTRTRFSVFEAWYTNLSDTKAIGTFNGWGSNALKGVESGHTVELRANLQIVPLQRIFRLFLWFAEQAKSQNTMFSQKGEQLKETKEAERTMRALMGDDIDSEVLVKATPVGDIGPGVVLSLLDKWMIGRIGSLDGTYSVIAQVERVLDEGEEWPAIRLARDAPVTELELRTLKQVAPNFVEPAKDFGVELDGTEATVAGPALVLSPIAIFR